MVLHHPYIPPSHDEAHAHAIKRTLQAIRTTPIVLCIRMKDASVALSAAKAAIRGGLLCIEVAMTTPSATQVMRDLIHACPNAIVGAGTVLTRDQVDDAKAAGARFALSPVTDVDIIRYCHECGVLAVPGAATPTECFQAFHSAGAKLVKIFPIKVCGGFDFVKAMQGPLGHIPLLPTSSIDFDTLPLYLQAGNVWAVGVSHQILQADSVASEDWDEITERAKVWVAAARGAVSDRSESLR